MISPAWALLTLFLIALYLAAMVYVQHTLEGFEDVPQEDLRKSSLITEVQKIHDAFCPLLLNVQKEIAKNSKSSQGPPTAEDLGKAFGRMVMEAEKPLYQFCPSYQDIFLMPSTFKTRILDTLSYLNTKVSSLNAQIETALRGELKDSENQDDPDANLSPIQKATRAAAYKSSYAILEQERMVPTFSEIEKDSFYNMRQENVRQLLNQKSEDGRPLFSSEIQKLSAEIQKLQETRKKAESGELQPNL